MYDARNGSHSNRTVETLDFYRTLEILFDGSWREETFYQQSEREFFLFCYSFSERAARPRDAVPGRRQ